MTPAIKAMRPFFGWRLLGLLLAAAAANAQVPNPPATNTAPTGTEQAPPSPAPAKEEVTVSAPHLDRTLPQLPPDEFTNCLSQIGLDTLERGNLSEFAIQSWICEKELNREKHIVIEACINRDGKTALPRAIQACTESLDRKILDGNARFYLFVNRAAAYFAAGDKDHALNDYNEAVRLAPKNADLRYNRGVFHAAQADEDAALQDFEAAVTLNPKLVPALRERAKICQRRGNFSAALADYSEAIRLQPKTAALWSERGYVSLRQHDYDAAVRDEAQAIELDPKLARAYFFRGAAFVGLGDSRKAVGDVMTAVRLDPTLDRYVKTAGKNASLGLPPL